MLYIVIILFLIFSGILAVVAFENFTTQVQISLFGWQSPVLPLGLLILLVFVLGAVLLYLVSATSAWQDWREMRQLRARNAELEAVIARRLAMQTPQTVSAAPEVQGIRPLSPPPIVPMPGMPTKQDISDIPTQH